MFLSFTSSVKTVSYFLKYSSSMKFSAYEYLDSGTVPTTTETWWSMKSWKNNHIYITNWQFKVVSVIGKIAYKA